MLVAQAINPVVASEHLFVRFVPPCMLICYAIRLVTQNASSGVNAPSEQVSGIPGNNAVRSEGRVDSVGVTNVAGFGSVSGAYNDNNNNYNSGHDEEFAARDGRRGCGECARCLVELFAKNCCLDWYPLHCAIES